MLPPFDVKLSPVVLWLFYIKNWYIETLHEYVPKPNLQNPSQTVTLSLHNIFKVYATAV